MVNKREIELQAQAFLDRYADATEHAANLMRKLGAAVVMPSKAEAKQAVLEAMAELNEHMRVSREKFHSDMAMTSIALSEWAAELRQEAQR